MYVCKYVHIYVYIYIYMYASVAFKVRRAFSQTIFTVK